MLWQREEEGRIFPKFGGEPDFAVVEFDDFFSQSQANAFADIRLILHIMLDTILVIVFLFFFTEPDII